MARQRQSRSEVAEWTVVPQVWQVAARFLKQWRLAEGIPRQRFVCVEPSPKGGEKGRDGGQVKRRIFVKSIS